MAKKEAPVSATPTAKPEAKAPKRKKAKRVVSEGVVQIHSTFNNTLVTITDQTGSVVAWSSAGAVGFKGSRKGTRSLPRWPPMPPRRRAMECGVRTGRCTSAGPGSGRESALRSLQSAGFAITVIRDVTPIPHNGCRAPKRRRV
jgi:small subunit ribosomal protein S11